MTSIACGRVDEWSGREAGDVDGEAREDERAGSDRINQPYPKNAREFLRERFRFCGSHGAGHRPTIRKTLATNYGFSVVVVVVVSFWITLGLVSTIRRTIMRSPSRT